MAKSKSYMASYRAAKGSASPSVKHAVIPSVKSPETPLKGTPKQVAWAQDIRDNLVSSINAYAVAQTAQGMEMQEKGGAFGERAKDRLAAIPIVMGAMGDGVAKIDSAKVLIDNFSDYLGMSKIPTLSEMRANEHDTRSAVMAMGDGVLNRLKRHGFVDSSIVSPGARNKAVRAMLDRMR